MRSHTPRAPIGSGRRVSTVRFRPLSIRVSGVALRDCCLTYSTNCTFVFQSVFRAWPSATLSEVTLAQANHCFNPCFGRGPPRPFLVIGLVGVGTFAFQSVFRAWPSATLSMGREIEEGKELFQSVFRAWPSATVRPTYVIEGEGA